MAVELLIESNLNTSNKWFASKTLLENAGASKPKKKRLLWMGADEHTEPYLVEISM